MECLENLPWHDAILERLEFSNDEICIGIHFQNGSRKVNIVSAHEINIDMKDDWGPSKSILSTHFSDDEILFSLQSGTNILIRKPSKVSIE